MKNFKFSLAILAIVLAVGSAFTTKPVAAAGWYVYPSNVKTLFGQTKPVAADVCFDPFTPICFQQFNEAGALISGTTVLGTYIPQ